MSDKLEVRVNGAVAYEATDGNHVLLKNGEVVFEHKQPVELPPPPPLPPIDYSDPRFNNPDIVNDREMRQHIQTWVFPNGMPQNWDWRQWSLVTGRDLFEAPNAREPAPDRSGSDFGSGASFRNRHITGQVASYSFTILPGKTPELVIAAAPGRGFFTKAIDDGPWSHRTYGPIARSTHKPDLSGLAPGTYSYRVIFDPQDGGREVWVNAHFHQS